MESVRTVHDFRGTGSEAMVGEVCGDVMFFYSLYLSKLTEIPKPNVRLTGITVGGSLTDLTWMVVSKVLLGGGMRFHQFTTHIGLGESVCV